MSLVLTAGRPRLALIPEDPRPHAAGSIGDRLPKASHSLDACTVVLSLWRYFVIVHRGSMTG